MKKYFVIWILLLIIVFFIMACSNKDSDTRININRDIVQIKEFEVSTNLSFSNTVVQGNAYVQNKQDHIEIIIIASIVIGENDWGGVAFYIPKGWDITSALSSYPDVSGNEAENNARIWYTAGEEREWGNFVEIGHELNQTPTGGGTGTVLIELTSNKDNVKFNVFSFLVSVGSEMKDGIPVVGKTSTLVEIGINATE